jgi:hypothetical protein
MSLSSNVGFGLDSPSNDELDPIRLKVRNPIGTTDRPNFVV